MNETNDPVSGMERSFGQHREPGAFLNFVATHLVPNEINRLSGNDLTRMELISRYL